MTQEKKPKYEMHLIKESDFDRILPLIEYFCQDEPTVSIEIVYLINFLTLLFE